MKLSVAALPAQIVVEIGVLDDRAPRWLHVHELYDTGYWHSYRDVVLLDTGEATLGSLMEVLEEIRGRSREEHEKLVATGRSPAPRRFDAGLHWGTPGGGHRGAEGENQQVGAGDGGDRSDVWSGMADLAL